MPTSKKPKAPRTITMRMDSFVNYLTGIGNLRDKRSSAFYQDDRLLDPQTLENVFHGNDIAARICELVPEEMLRQGITLNIGGNEEGSDSNREITTYIMAMLDDLCLREKFTDAGVWANVFGGAVILIGADDGNAADEPLDEESIQSLNFLTVLDKRDLTPSAWYNDPLMANYGMVSTYRINPNNLMVSNPGFPVNSLSANFQSTQIHESRLIVFDGTRTTLRRKQSNEGWSISLLQRVWEVLTDFNMTWNSMANLMQDVSQGVIKMKDLAQMIAEGEEANIRRRMEEVDMSRGVGQALVLDAEFEDFKRDTASLAGLPEMLEKFMLRLGSAAKIPASLFISRPPTGLNASGDPEMRRFYDDTKSNQMYKLKPKIERIVEIIMLCKDGPTNGEVIDFEVCFPPLWQNNESEEAQIRLAVAQTDVAYINSGVLLPEEVAISRFRPEGYSTETIVDLESRSEELKLKATQPEPPPPQEVLPPTTAPVVENADQA